MPNYNFKQDHEVAVKTEQQIADLIKQNNAGKIKRIQFNNDNRYDLGILMNDGTFITIEIKEDFTCAETGNIGLEFECRGRASGIAVSRADMYMYKVHQPNGDIGFYMIETSGLKNLIKTKAFHRIVTGGDVGSDSKNYLFRLEILQKNARLYHTIRGDK